MDKIKKLINNIKTEKFFKNQIHSIIEIPENPPIYSKNINLSPSIKKYLKNKNITNLFIHQAEAIKKIREEKNIIITTSTASGKTLSFNIPVFEEIEKDKNTTALYIYPAKALTNDQLKVIEEFKNISKMNFISGIYDGDTSAELKKFLREKANIILTNPYELHHTLPYHVKWKEFFKNLKFVIIDEAHKYTGIFGSNVAFLLRRLKRIFKLYKANPQYIVSTASLSNPEEFIKNLTGENFYLIKKDGAPSSKKYLILWDSFVYPEKSVHTQTKDILLFTTKNNFQTLTFTTSRKLSEIIRKWANKENKNIEILSYRAGYSPQLRREIEKKLKKGIIKGVVSTNALELGIDIGSLDIIIISGYPGTISSFWQQAGRAGREMNESAIFFLPYEDALQKYLLKHPEILINKNFENGIISLENPNIIANHILCAIAETPSKTKKIFDDIETDEMIKILENEKLIIKSPVGYIYTSNIRPHNIVTLNNIGGDKIKIKIDKKILEEISIERAFREAYTGAVYLHNGETYLIKNLSLNEKVAYAEKQDVDYYTEVIKNEEVKIKKILSSQKFKTFTLYFGEVSVTEFYTAYKIKKKGKVESINKLNLPTLNFQTESIWIELNYNIVDKIKKLNFDFEGSIHAAEHALISLSPLFAMCDRNDIGGISYSIYENTCPVIFIYDGYEGGIGISKKLFEIFSKLVSSTINMIEECPCENGCPSCVYSPKCGNNNNPIDKYGAVLLLKSLK